MILETLIRDYYCRSPNTTFAELVRADLDARFGMLGDCEIVTPADPSVASWGNMSLEFPKEIGTLQANARIYLNPVHPVAYLVDGCTLQLLLASNPPLGGCRTLHWLRVFISPYSVLGECCRGDCR